MEDYDEKLIRVFVHRNDYTPIDSLAFVGNPTKKILDTFSKEIPVAISVTFTWDIQEGLRLFTEWSKYFKNVKIGGVAFKYSYSKEFISGKFVRKGVVFTSRGCNRCCPWCHEHYTGKLKELSNIEKGWIVEDANLLACSNTHLTKVFKMLREEINPIIFAGGFDMRLFNEKHLDLLNSINIDRIYFATDIEESIKKSERVSKLLFNKPKSWKYTYTLCGFNGETIQQAKDKIKRIKDNGFIPKVMLFQDNQWIHYSDEWLQLKEENNLKKSLFSRIVTGKEVKNG